MKNAITGRQRLAPSMRTSKRPQRPAARSQPCRCARRRLAEGACRRGGKAGPRPGRSRRPRSSGSSVRAGRRLRGRQCARVPACCRSSRRRHDHFVAAVAQRSEPRQHRSDAVRLRSPPDDDRNLQPRLQAWNFSAHLSSPAGRALSASYRPRTCCLRRAWVDVDGAEDFLQPDAVLHRSDEFDDEIGRVFPGDRRAQDPVLPGAVRTLTTPVVSPSAIARSRSSRG